MRSPLAILALIFALPCSAQEDGESLSLPANTLTGIGRNDCDFYIEWVERGDNPAIASSWIFGFWSAYNIYMVSIGWKPKDLSAGVASNVVALDAVILGRCYENRSLPLMQVAMDVFKDLPTAIDERGVDQ